MVPGILVRFKTEFSIGEHPFRPEGSLESLCGHGREGWRERMESDRSREKEGRRILEN